MSHILRTSTEHKTASLAEKYKLMAVTAMCECEFNLLISESQGQFFGSYALIQVFRFCSTKLTCNSIIKHKNLSTNKYVWFNKAFSLYLTKLFIVKKIGYLNTTIHISYTIHNILKLK